MKPKARWTWQWHPLRHTSAWRRRDSEGFWFAWCMLALLWTASASLIWGLVSDPNHKPHGYEFWTTVRVVTAVPALLPQAALVAALLALLLRYAGGLLARHPPVRREVRDRDREEYEAAKKRVYEYENGKI